MDLAALLIHLRGYSFSPSNITQWGNWDNRLVIKTTTLPMCITMQQHLDTYVVTIFRYVGNVGQAGIEYYPVSEYSLERLITTVTHEWRVRNPDKDERIADEIFHNFNILIQQGSPNGTQNELIFNQSLPVRDRVES